MTATATVTRLFQAHTVVDKWEHRGARYNGLKLHWIAQGSDRFAGQYPALLDGYDPDDPYQPSLVNELLTADEVEALERYLKERHDEVLVVEEVSLPHPTVAPEGGGYIAMGDVPFGGGRDAYELWREDGYDLPASIVGVFDVNGQDPAEVRACGHRCEHHAPLDLWEPYEPPPPPLGGHADDPPF